MEVLVTTYPNRADRLCAPLEAAGVTVRMIARPQINGRLPANLHWIGAISSAAAEGADAFFSHEGGFIGLWTALEAQRHGIPVIMRWRGDFWQEQEDRRLQGEIGWLRAGMAALMLSELAALSDLILPVSQSLSRSVIEHTHCPGEKVRAIPIPVDISRFSPEADSAAFRETTGREHIVGLAMVFRYLQKVQGLVHFLPVLRALVEARDDTAVVIAGDGRLREQFEAQYRDLLDHPAIMMVGHVADMPAFYQGLDVFCHFSFFDACPNVLFEAWGSGRPVVVNAYSPLMENVVDGANGRILANDAAVGDCLAVFDRLLDDEPYRRALGMAGREFVAENMSLEAVGAKLVEALEDTVDA